MSGQPKYIVYLMCLSCRIKVNITFIFTFELLKHKMNSETLMNLTPSGYFILSFHPNLATSGCKLIVYRAIKVFSYSYLLINEYEFRYRNLNPLIIFVGNKFRFRYLSDISEYEQEKLGRKISLPLILVLSCENC